MATSNLQKSDKKNSLSSMFKNVMSKTISSTTDADSDVKHHDERKNVLLSHLKTCAKNLLISRRDVDVILTSSPSNKFCDILEAIFLHGIKESYLRRVSMYVKKDNLLSPTFWPVLVHFSPKDVISQLTCMEQLKSEVGLCRGWMRLALNDQLLASYIYAMLSDCKTLFRYYDSWSLFLDEEISTIVLDIIKGTESIAFKLSCNVSLLNEWNVQTLELSGFLKPRAISTPTKKTVPEDRVISCTFPNDQDSVYSEYVTDELSSMFKLTPKTDEEKNDFSIKKCPLLESSSFPGVTSSFARSNKNDEPAGSRIHSTNTLIDSKFGINLKEPLYNFRNPMGMFGNQIGPESSSWSTALEFSDDEILALDSAVTASSTTPDGATTDKTYTEYSDLLDSYSTSRVSSVKTMTDILKTLPVDGAACTTPLADELVDSYDFLSLESFVVIPNHLANHEHRTERLLSLYDKVMQERGLDAQDFKCSGCSQPLGILYGGYKMCHVDGSYYCGDCFGDDTRHIPAFIMHNWDFAKYPVSKYSAGFLTQVAEEPLIQMTDCQLYSIYPELEEVLKLREQLKHLRSYLFTCKRSVMEDLRRLVWPREYLMEDQSLYSVTDLLQVRSGKLAQHLNSVVKFAKKHVLGCLLCSQRGFVCEICHDRRVLFPFDLDGTSKCADCNTIYHSACKSEDEPCPKCQRQAHRKQWRDNGASPLPCNSRHR